MTTITHSTTAELDAVLVYFRKPPNDVGVLESIVRRPVSDIGRARSIGRRRTRYNSGFHRRQLQHARFIDYRRRHRTPLNATQHHERTHCSPHNLKQESRAIGQRPVLY